jgi:hypothetical protein
MRIGIDLLFEQSAVQIKKEFTDNVRLEHYAM